MRATFSGWLVIGVFAEVAGEVPGEQRDAEEDQDRAGDAEREPAG